MSQGAPFVLLVYLSEKTRITAHLLSIGIITKKSVFKNLENENLQQPEKRFMIGIKMVLYLRITG